MFAVHFWITLRSGHVVIALVPNLGAGCAGSLLASVAMVTSVWMNVKKPRLATSSIPCDQCTALRIVQLESGSGISQWQCNEVSSAWVVRPQAIVAVLDVADVSKETAGCKVILTQGSVDLVEKMESIPSWWPELKEDDPTQKGKRNPAQQLLYVHRQGRKRKTAEGPGDGPAPPEPTDGQPSEGAEVPKPRLKRAKETPLIPEDIQNFRRTSKGAALIQQMLEKAKALDSKKFVENTAFSKDDVCRVEHVSCKGVSWETLFEKAPDFFRAEHLGWREWKNEQFGGKSFSGSTWSTYV